MSWEGNPKGCVCICIYICLCICLSLCRRLSRCIGRCRCTDVDTYADIDAYADAVGGGANVLYSVLKSEEKRKTSILCTCLTMALVSLYFPSLMITTESVPISSLYMFLLIVLLESILCAIYI